MSTLPISAIYGTLKTPTLVRLDGFGRWFDSLPEKGKAQIQARLLRIASHAHFGDEKDLGEGLRELRWKNGWRVYFAIVHLNPELAVLLILGGTKNGQKKDIRQARALLRRYTETQAERPDSDHPA